MAAALAKFRGTSYVRTPESITMQESSATERGTWIRRWGSNELRGRYTAVWRRTVGGNGTPSWTLHSEITNQ
jgi:hypothetical protein